MGEFKFACPVCGQHLTADAKASGTPLECPTCFQKLVVPQAPAAADSKLILAAAQLTRPRPGSDAKRGDSWLLGGPEKSTLLPAVILAVCVLGLGAAAYHWRKPLLSRFTAPREWPTNRAKTALAPPPTIYPLPTNTAWTLSLTNATVPAATAVGAIRGTGFVCERVTLQAGALTLRQGRTWPPDLGVTVVLFAQAGEELAGKTVVVTPERPPPVPKVILRWKDAQQKAVTRNFTGGYALKVVFGQPEKGRMPGTLYLALPDDEKSFVAGTFDAEIRKPSPPKPKPPPKATAVQSAR